MTDPIDASTEVDTTDIFDFYDIEIGELEGRRISRHTLSEFYEKVKQKTHDLFIKDAHFRAIASEFMRNLDAKWFIHQSLKVLRCEQNSLTDPTFITEFACPSGFFPKDIEDLRTKFLNREYGFFKSIGKFWKKYKVPILVGTGIAAVVGTVIVVSVFTGGAAAGIAAAAGAAALDKKKPESKPENSPPPQNVASKPQEPSPSLPEYPPTGGLWINGQFYPYVSDQKSSDFRFISSLPPDFRHNLAVQSIGSISSLGQFSWNSETRLVIPPLSFPVLSKPCINPPPILPNRFPVDGFQSNSVLQAMGKEIVNNPWLLNPENIVRS